MRTIVCLLTQPTFKPGDLPPEGYLAWHEWAAVQHKAGLRQRECGKCGRWKYPQELSDEIVRIEGRTSRGARVSLGEPVCKACVEASR